MGGELTVPVEVDVPEEVFERAEAEAEANGDPVEAELFNRTVFEVRWKTD